MLSSNSALVPQMSSKLTTLFSQYECVEVRDQRCAKKNFFEGITKKSKPKMFLILVAQAVPDLLNVRGSADEIMTNSP